MLNNNVTSFSFNFVDAIEKSLLRYSESKESLDSKLAKAVQFSYKVVDSFENAGYKIPASFEKTAIFVDCSYLE